jgi:hypothetical protein
LVDVQPEIIIRIPRPLGDDFSPGLQSVTCYTSAQNPVESLADISELAPSQVLVSAPQLALVAERLLASSGEPRSCVGLRVLRPGESPHAFGPNDPIRLLISESDEGPRPFSNAGIRLRFEQED